MRSGIGYDIHRLVSGRRLVLGGIEIECEKGLLGHSDADVLLHAICDALLGAAAMGDIGRHFPDTDPAWKDASGITLLEKTWRMVSEKFCSVINIDATIFAQEPRLSPYMTAMTEKISDSLGTESSRVNIKATTTEGLGIIGDASAIAAMCVVLLE
ncbi:MAG: 2-C-methyl-D-erythritol 2,4-cyclodiphosphate synthase [Desulfobacteraceae bacterium]|nr:2-C-methyl-D-erythritol 2,4-cyclodiphosphate synthase [Desulfobacteraceae bacterium]